MPVPSQHPATRSIFAHELEKVVASRGMRLADLRRKPVSLDHKKVDALEISLSNISRLPALNLGEIMSVVLMLGLGDDERLGIYAALIALGVQRTLLDLGMLDDRVWSIVIEVREASYTWLKRQQEANSDPFRKAHTTSSVHLLDRSGNGHILSILHDYDEGVRLSTLGRLDQDATHGRSFLEQALLCLGRAGEAMDSLASSPKGSEDWPNWRQDIEHEIEIVRQELE